MAVEVNKIFQGEVSAVHNYGAFIKIPGLGRTQGLVHKSQISSARVDDATEVLALNDKIWCKVISVSDDNKIGLSMKVVDQGSGRDLDPNGVQTSLDVQQRKERGGYHESNAITLDAVFKTKCSKCGVIGHLSKNCFKAPDGKAYDLIPEPEPVKKIFGTADDRLRRLAGYDLLENDGAPRKPDKEERKKVSKKKKKRKECSDTESDSSPSPKKKLKGRHPGVVSDEPPKKKLKHRYREEKKLDSDSSDDSSMKRLKPAHRKTKRRSESLGSSDFHERKSKHRHRKKIKSESDGSDESSKKKMKPTHRKKHDSESDSSYQSHLKKLEHKSRKEASHSFSSNRASKKKNQTDHKKHESESDSSDDSHKEKARHRHDRKKK